jgi:hypothetical protein
MRCQQPPFLPNCTWPKSKGFTAAYVVEDALADCSLGRRSRKYEVLILAKGRFRKRHDDGVADRLEYATSQPECVRPVRDVEPPGGPEVMVSVKVRQYAPFEKLECVMVTGQLPV